MVLALEVGGRWRDEATGFVQQLAKAKARMVPRILRPSVRAAYFHRWTGMLAVAAQRALAATLMELPVDDAEGVDGGPPTLEDVLLDARLLDPPQPSRVV